jgi:hypothetical protein
MNETQQDIPRKSVAVCCCVETLMWLTLCAFNSTWKLLFQKTHVCKVCRLYRKTWLQKDYISESTMVNQSPLHCGISFLRLTRPTSERSPTRRKTAWRPNIAHVRLTTAGWSCRPGRPAALEVSGSILKYLDG